MAYGAPRELLLGLRFIDGRGRLINARRPVVKNVAGYDMTRSLPDRRDHRPHHPSDHETGHPAGALRSGSRPAVARSLRPPGDAAARLQPGAVFAAGASMTAAGAGGFGRLRGFRRNRRRTDGRGRAVFEKADFRSIRAEDYACSRAVRRAVRPHRRLVPSSWRIGVPPDRAVRAAAILERQAQSKSARRFRLRDVFWRKQLRDGRGLGRHRAGPGELAGYAVLEKARMNSRPARRVGPLRPEWALCTGSRPSLIQSMSSTGEDAGESLRGMKNNR